MGRDPGRGRGREKGKGRIKGGLIPLVGWSGPYMQLFLSHTHNSLVKMPHPHCQTGGNGS